MHKYGNTEQTMLRYYNVNKIICKHRNTKKNQC